MNLYFEKIILHNFASYTHSEVNLTGKGFCLVSGRNLYIKDNSYSNGSGKSMIWNGICLTLTGEPIKGNKNGLKNNLVEEEDCYTELHFKDDADSYIITRYLAPKSDLHIIKNGEDISGKGIRESEKKLGEVLPNLNKELITSIVLFGQGMPQAFSKLAPSGRKELLEKLTNSDFMIEAIKTRALDVATELNSTLRQEEDSILVKNTLLTTENKTITECTNTLETAVKPDFAAKINELTVNINKLSTTLIEYKTSQTNNTEGLTNVSNQLSELLTKKNTELAELQESYNNVLPAGIKKRSDLEADLRSTETELTKIKNIKEFCPTCGQKIIGAHKPDTSALEAKKVSLKEALANINEEFKRLDTEYKNAVAEINKSYQDQINGLEAKKNAFSAGIKSDGNKITELTSQKGQLETTLEQVKQESVNYDINLQNIRNTLDKAKLKKIELEKDLTDLNASKQITADRVAVLKKIDTIIKRDLRGHLLTNIITFINKKSKEFCKTVFGTTEIEIFLDGNALDITYCGKMFDNLSGGEQMRVDLILQLAIRDMLRSYLNLQSNILVLDEVTDFLDKQSCKAVMTLIEKELKSVESVFIVTHHAESLSIPVDTELKIEKNEQGLSSII